VTVQMLHGPRVLRVEWLPGTDRLHGTCFCGTAHEAEDPIEMWEWLLDHRDSHDGTPATVHTGEPVLV
jgi:hypothetical protein